MLYLPWHPKNQNLPMQKPNPFFEPKHTNPFIWCVALVCAVLAVAVIITGIVVFVGYILIHPKVPFISVSYANLDRFGYTQAGLLTTQLTVIVKAENDNARAHASFYAESFLLSFYGVILDNLQASPFDVGKNSSIELKYVAEASEVPLGPVEQDIVDKSIKSDSIIFELKGNARTRWRIGFLGSVKFWLHLNCQLHFFVNGSSYRNTYCSTRSK